MGDSNNDIRMEGFCSQEVPQEMKSRSYADAVRNLTQSHSINLGDDITCNCDATRIKNIC